MFIWIYDAIILISAFLFAAAGTGAAYALMRRLNVVDMPNARSNHAQPTPRGGGLGIIFASLCFLMVVDASGHLIWGMLALAALSLWDDFYTLEPQKRLLGQCVVVVWVLLFAFEGQVFGGILPRWVELPLLALAWLWFMNLYNFMDGADGLAASEALCISVGLLAVGAVVALPATIASCALVIAGSVLGFAVWNWSPARIFMGDVGSIPLGFVLGFLLLLLAGAGYWAAALILPAVFVADASITLARRLSKRERIFEAHSSHAYQRAIRGGMSHSQLAQNVIGANIVLITLAALSTLNNSFLWASGCVMLAYALVFALLSYFIRYRQTTHAISEAEVIEEIPAKGTAALPHGNGNESVA